MILLLVLILTSVVLVAQTIRSVRTDGYGQRPGPSSHETWDRGASPFTERY